VERIRSSLQRSVIRTSYRLAERSVLTVPVKSVSWLPARSRKVSFIPVGANVPSLHELKDDSVARAPGRKTVAVFGITGGGSVPREVEDIAFVMNHVARHVGRLRLVTLGRGSKEAEEKLRRALNGAPVEFVARGLLPSEEVSRTLAASDAMLFTRSHLSTNSTTAIAAISCGLPLIAYSKPQALPPLTKAGVLLVPSGDREQLAEATVRVLNDERLRQDLRSRSLSAYGQYFSWEAIADRYIQSLATISRQCE
jgi:glycosyltransferase involved in cell wall biosynthesis